MSNEERAYAIADLKKVIAAQEAMVREGFKAPKLGQYWDELYALIEESRKEVAQ